MNKKTLRKKHSRARPWTLEVLESRWLMNADLSLPVFEPPIAAETSGDSTATTTSTQAPLTYGLDNLPALNSLLGAPASLYLDFDGHNEPQWGAFGAVATPAFDQDGDPGTFSDSELASIRYIWAYVAEDYAPLAINVTTVEPSSFADGDALRVVIGGDSSWLGGLYGGVSYIDSFTNWLPNTVYVFPKNLANGNAKYTADVASHEAGHGFGLQHQSDYDADGTKTSEYETGSGDGRAPLMGNSYRSARSLWWNGPSSRSASSYQDDLAVLARAANGFGYRADDHGDSLQAATPLTRSGSQVSGSGLIGASNDADYFSFQAGPGQVSLMVDVPANVQNLDATLQLQDANRTVLATADPATGFGASLVATVAGGVYYLRVGSQGNDGDVGAYSVRGTVPAATTTKPPASTATTFAAPTNLSAQVVSSNQINLAWQDNSTSETGFRIEYFVRQVGRWARVADVGPDVTTYSDTSVVGGRTYYYRVRSISDAEVSRFGNIVRAITPITKRAWATIAAASQVPAASLAAGHDLLNPPVMDAAFADHAWLDRLRVDWND